MQKTLICQDSPIFIVIIRRKAMQATQVSEKTSLGSLQEETSGIAKPKGGKGLPTETLRFPGYSMLEVSVGRRLRRQIPQSFL
jgi:hypothetical protein